MTVKVASINSKMYGLVVVDGLYTICNISLPSINIMLLIEGLIHNLLIISILNYNGYNVVSNKMTCNVISKKMDMSSLVEQGWWIKFSRMILATFIVYNIPMLRHSMHLFYPLMYLR